MTEFSRDQSEPDLASESLLLVAIKNVHINDRAQVIHGKDDEKKLQAEVDRLIARHEDASSVLRALFPSELPVDPSFYDKLIGLHLRLGWGDEANRAIGVLLMVAVRELGAERGDDLLRFIPDKKNRFFFQLLDSLDFVVSQTELRPKFAAEWFPALLRRIGNDLASGGFWKALETYCLTHSQSAVEALALLLDTNNEEEIAVAAHMLGSLRRLNSETAAAVESIESKLSVASSAAARAIYHRSWLETAWRGKIVEQDLELLTARMLGGSAEERNEVIGLICKALLSPTLSPECRKYCWSWLRANVSKNVDPVAKYNVVDMADRMPKDAYKNAAELILQIEEFPCQYKGVWQRLEPFLIKMLKLDPKYFQNFIVRLATVDGADLVQILDAPDQYHWFLSELQNADVGNILAQLIFTGPSSCQEVGLKLFEKLQVTTLPAEFLQSVSERRIAIAFYECQRSMMNGPAIANLLLFLIPYMERVDPALKEEFYDEILLQSKNYGSCLEVFGKHAKEYPILEKAVAETEKYFAILKSLVESTINQMQVVGFARAARLSARRFASEVSEGAEALSVFAKLFKKVRLLYGREWRTYYGGQLGDSSRLQQISTSVEFPRMEFVDPEGMQLRRLHAALRLRQLEQSQTREG